MLSKNTKPIIIGGVFLRTTSKGSTSPISEVASTTPEIGEIARPIDAAMFIGRSIESAEAPAFSAILGIKGPKAKNAALALPMTMEAK